MLVNINTSIVPFSRRYTKLMLWRDHDSQLWLGCECDRFTLIKVQAVRGDAVVEVNESTTPGKLTLTDNSGGALEFVYGYGETLLIRGCGGLGVKFSVELDGKYITAPDTMACVVFEQHGEFMFESIKGIQRNDLTDKSIAWYPYSDALVFGCIYFAEENLVRPDNPIGDFNVHEIANYSDFRRWDEQYSHVPVELESQRSMYIYTTWVCCE